MAIYHFSAQIISRGKGQSAVAAAAYRSGDKLQDERTGEEKFYKREVQPETMILAPKNAPGWVHDRERLWNEVEKIEKNKNSQLAREINVALPVELSNDRQRELIKDFIQEEFVDRGMVADISIHRDDKSNPHAHIMLTVRQFDEDGKWGNKKRKDYELDQEGNKIPDKDGKPKYKTVSLTDWDKKENLVQWREEWANHANKALEREGSLERISHLSHEARGLEQLPTVHLGHINNEMEKRGVTTVRGDVNRERQEYNNLVIDLQKYREEKQAIEQAKARQLEQPNKIDQERFFLPKEDPAAQVIQKEIIEKYKPEFEGKKTGEKVEVPSKQKAQSLYTSTEQTHLQSAQKILKVEPSLENIQERHKQIDRWELRVTNAEQFNKWKDQTIKEATQHFSAISGDKNTIQQQKEIKDEIEWHKPWKLKENLKTKEQAENTILSCNKSIETYDEKLNYHREKLGFTTEVEFKKIQVQHEKEKPESWEKNRNQRSQISRERDTLKNAEIALKNGVVRELASKYPERPEMRYMSFEKASELMKMNEKAGRIIPVKEIKAARDQRHTKIQELNKELHFVEKESVRLKRTDGFLKEADKSNSIVEKHKGKWFRSKAVKKEYEDAISTRDFYKNEAKQNGVSDKDDWKKQNQSYENSAAKVPSIQAKLQPLQRGLGILDSLMKGIEQAGQEAKRQQMRQQQRQQGKSKKHSWEDREQGRGR